MSTLTIEKQPARHIPDKLSTPAGRIRRVRAGHYAGILPRRCLKRLREGIALGLKRAVAAAAILAATIAPAAAQAAPELSISDRLQDRPSESAKRLSQM